MVSRDDLAKEAGDEGEGQSTGTPAEGSMDVGAREPIETSGVHHWQEATITRPGLDDRGNVFFAAIEMTRMPMVITDPHKEDNPIVFANNAFLDLTLYEKEEVLGQVRALQASQQHSGPQVVSVVPLLRAAEPAFLPHAEARALVCGG